jgi:molecular chaperone DnaK (HSP70)
LQIDNSLNQPVFPTITLTIEEFGEICKNTLLKVERVVENTIKIYRNTIQSRQSIGIENYEDSIDEVVLVGGSSKVPFVRLRVSKALYDAGYHKFHGHLGNHFITSF